MNAVIYARVSSTNDRKSTDRQVTDLKKYATTNGLNIVKTFEEHISGAKLADNARFCSNCGSPLN